MVYHYIMNENDMRNNINTLLGSSFETSAEHKKYFSVELILPNDAKRRDVLDHALLANGGNLSGIKELGGDIEYVYKIGDTPMAENVEILDKIVLSIPRDEANHDEILSLFKKYKTDIDELFQVVMPSNDMLTLDAQ